MRAFLSYTFGSEDDIIIRQLGNELMDKGFSLSQSYDFKPNIHENTEISIRRSELFIGILTANNKDNNRIKKEWAYALEMGLPTIILVEKNVKLNNNALHIRFDRENPNKAIEALNNKIKSMQNKPAPTASSFAWVLGGLAIIAIAAMLFRKK